MARRQDGSALAMVPAAALVFTILAASAVDHDQLLIEQRRLVTTVEAAVADGVAAGVDLGVLHDEGTVAYRADAIDRAVRATVAADDPGSTVRWAVHGEVLEVWLTHPVPLVFAPAVPGARRVERIEAHASATLAR